MEIKHEIKTENIINNLEEENEDTFNRLENLLKSKNIEFTLMEVKIK